MTEQNLGIREEEIQTHALALPDGDTFKRDMLAINSFQQVAKKSLVENLDYGVIPGTTKPTLLKPGAEKIAKLLGLCDYYEILDRQEQWEQGFFRYLIKCKLVDAKTAVVVSEGLGECNSFEGKYRYRWVHPNRLPEGVDRQSLPSKKARAGTLYRQDNEDIYAQVNTILKMAKKRSLVDAALSAGRLSQIFTQDIEEDGVLDAASVDLEAQVEDATSANGEAPAKPASEKCKACGKPMTIRNGQNGPFLGCTGYPGCKNTKPINGSVSNLGTRKGDPMTGEEFWNKTQNTLKLKDGQVEKLLHMSPKKYMETRPDYGWSDVYEHVVSLIEFADEQAADSQRGL